MLISLKKTNVMGQGVESPASISISDYEQEVVHQFTYSTLALQSLINSALDPEIGRKIEQAAESTLLYGSDGWTLLQTQKTCAAADASLTSNGSRAQMPSFYTMLQHRRLRWLGHIHNMTDGRIIKKF